MTERELMLAAWDDLWTNGRWAAPWRRTLEGLTAAQAAWKPGQSMSGGGGKSDRHSIWQIVHHIVFWRGYVIDRMRGGPTLPDAEIAARTFEEPKRADDASWKKTVEAFAASQQRVREALAADSCNVDRVRGMPYHDCYHIGQIMTLRALQGLPPVE